MVETGIWTSLVSFVVDPGSELGGRGVKEGHIVGMNAAKKDQKRASVGRLLSNVCDYCC